MIDPTAETLLFREQAAKHPFFRNRDGKDAHPHKVCRYMLKGARRRADGERVKLASGAIVTSKEAIDRMIAAINGQPAQVGPKQQRRQREQHAATAYLNAAGL